MKKVLFSSLLLSSISISQKSTVVDSQCLAKLKRSNYSSQIFSKLISDKKVLRRWGARQEWVLLKDCENGSKSELFETIEPNYIYHRFDTGPDSSPKDAKYSDLWAFKNSGQKDFQDTPGTVGADMQAEGAWALTRGSKSVVVAILDSGIDVNHPDLKDNLWEMPGNKKVHGRNVIEGENPDSLKDDVGHGTHVAGTIGAVGGNGRGVVGVNWQVGLMVVRGLNKDGGNAADLAAGIQFAADNGARVINASWGGSGESQAIREAIEYAREKGVLFVAAAGNGGWDQIGDDNDHDDPMYPASYPIDNIVSVAASDHNDQLTAFSNFGIKSVHVMAPGWSILSTLPWGRYAVDSGTSMAAPQVSGAAALLLSHEPMLTYAELKNRILHSVDVQPSAQGKVMSGGRLNLARLIGGK